MLCRLRSWQRRVRWAQSPQRSLLACIQAFHKTLSYLCDLDPRCTREDVPSDVQSNKVPRTAEGTEPTPDHFVPSPSGTCPRVGSVRQDRSEERRVGKE